jgi:hypothetical protein
LTAKIVDLTREYAVIVAVTSLLSALRVSLTVVGEKQIDQTWLDATQGVVAGAIGAMAGFGVNRIAYVIWRDHDRQERVVTRESA